MEKIRFETPKDVRNRIAEFMKAQNEKYQSTAADDNFRQQWRENALARQQMHDGETEAERQHFAELTENVELDSADRAELDREKENNIGGLIAHGMSYGEAVRQAELMATEAEQARKHTKATNILMNERLRRGRGGATVQMSSSQSPESREMNAIFRRAAGRK